ncbi:MAG TPA: MlaD family protein [Solirubrobacteraceae bacterium]|nr:MlaD family protein [Solirubrobacteraceae bacterium]
MRRLALIALVLVAAAGIVAVASASGGPGGGDPYLVTAFFDDASFAVQGEQVRVAGAPVGSIAALNVCVAQTVPCRPGTLNKAAVTLELNDSRFAPFHANATCAIRPQSLIGEMYVDCNPGTAAAPVLQKIRTGPGKGSYYLPVTQTSSPVDFDIVQDIYQEPVAQRLAIILNELGTGLAARGSDLNAVIRRADPALGNTDQVLKILAGQNKELAKLATDSNAVLAPLAQQRTALAGFITQANTTSQASAARAADISKSIQLLPGFLTQLKPLMADLGTLADQGTPLASDLGQSAAALGREFQELTPFASAARTALINLGAGAQQSQAPLVATIPLAKQLDQLGTQAVPTATELNTLTASLNKTGAINQLMAVLFNGTNAANGFDSLGHYVRDELLVSDCTGYAITPVPGCSARFAKNSAAADVASAAAVSPASKAILSNAVTQAGASVARASAAPLNSLLDYLIGPGG